jgi:import inner membrane translocase subunit TIM10
MSRAQEEAAAAAQAMAMATTELEYRVELLNKMVAGCYTKCAAKP